MNNTDIDVASDTIHPAPPIHLEVTLPSWLNAKKVAAQVLTPDGPECQRDSPADYAKVSWHLK